MTIMTYSGFTYKRLRHYDVHPWSPKLGKFWFVYDSEGQLQDVHFETLKEMKLWIDNKLEKAT